jgi:hypothetical protein
MATRDERALFIVKLVHTLVWALMAGAILALPWLALQQAWDWAIAIVVLIVFEGIVLVANGWRCPLTDIAARYTDERQHNFDIFLPLWLAEWNKVIFGTLFLAGVVLLCISAAGAA